MKKTVVEKKTNSKLDRAIAYILAILGTIGLMASLGMTIEYIGTLKDPAFVPICNINPIISCGSVLDTSQGEIFFGIPNPLLGIAGYTAMAVTGLALLAGATFKRWFWLGLQAGTVMAAGFAMWLFYQGIFIIGSICPFCTVVWLTSVPIFWYTTLYNFRNGHIKTPEKLKAVGEFAQRHHADILFLWFITLLGIVLHEFWYYWKTLI